MFREREKMINRNTHDFNLHPLPPATSLVVAQNVSIAEINLSIKDDETRKRFLLINERTSETTFAIIHLTASSTFLVSLLFAFLLPSWTFNLKSASFSYRMSNKFQINFDSWMSQSPRLLKSNTKRFGRCSPSTSVVGGLFSLCLYLHVLLSRSYQCWILIYWENIKAKESVKKIKREIMRHAAINLMRN